MKETLYEILGVDKAATADEVAAAYQQRKAQLDAAGDPASRNELKRVQHSYSVLSQAAQRDRYDRQLAVQSAQSAATLVMTPIEPQAGSGGLFKFALLIGLAVGGYMAYHRMSERAKGAEAATRDTTLLQPETALPAAAPLPASQPQPAAQTVEPQVQAQPSEPVKPADIYDIGAVPLPSPENQRQAYTAFLALRGSRAFVICNDGRVIYHGGSAQSVSQKLSAMPYGCSVYAIDDRVVWSGK